MPSTRSSSHRAAINTMPARTRTLRPLPHRIDNAAIAPATTTKKPVGKLPRQRRTTTTTKRSKKSCEPNASPDALNGTTPTTANAETSTIAPARISTKTSKKSCEANALESLDALNGTTHTSTSRHTTGLIFHRLIATIVMLVMALVSIRSTYGFLAPHTTDDDEEEKHIPVCLPGFNVYEITAQSWNFLPVKYSLTPFDNPHESVQDVFLSHPNLFMASKDEEGYEADDEPQMRLPLSFGGRSHHQRRSQREHMHFQPPHAFLSRLPWTPTWDRCLPIRERPASGSV